MSFDDGLVGEGRAAQATIERSAPTLVATSCDTEWGGARRARPCVVCATKG